jgi:D-3-phosphoglycerate dehydrogenase / 2-oxoglutarate reductase
VQIAILEPKDFSKKALKYLSNVGTVEQYNNENLDEFLFNKEVLFIRLAYLIDKDFLNKLNKIKYICTPTTGLNHIDIEECDKRKIKVISLKGEYDFLTTIRATPEHTFGLTLALIRNYKRALFIDTRSNEWNRDKYKGHELYNNSVGIIGFGRVGKVLDKYFSAFDSQVYFYDKSKSLINSGSATRVNSIEELIGKSNIVILAASYSEENYLFFDCKYINLLKNKFFVNISRGELIDENYLLKKIKNNFFKGIAIDVIQNEQLINNNLNLFLELPKDINFIITPHIAGATYNSMHATEGFIVKKLINKL